MRRVTDPVHVNRFQWAVFFFPGDFTGRSSLVLKTHSRQRTRADIARNLCKQFDCVPKKLGFAHFNIPQKFPDSSTTKAFLVLFDKYFRKLSVQIWWRLKQTLGQTETTVSRLPISAQQHRESCPFVTPYHVATFEQPRGSGNICWFSDGRQRGKCSRTRLEINIVESRESLVAVSNIVGRGGSWSWSSMSYQVNGIVVQCGSMWINVVHSWSLTCPTCPGIFPTGFPLEVSLVVADGSDIASPCSPDEVPSWGQQQGTVKALMVLFLSFSHGVAV